MTNSPVHWRKSSYSTAGGSDCVEVAFGQAISVRDSKNSSGPVLDFATSSWEAFQGLLRRR